MMQHYPSYLLFLRILMKVYQKVGYVLEEDCSCESDLVIPTMDCMVQAIKKTYWWITVN